MKSLRSILLLLLSLVALGSRAADSGNFQASDIRVMRVTAAGHDLLAIYFRFAANNHSGHTVGFGAYLYTTDPSNSINVSSFRSFKPQASVCGYNNYCLLIPYSQVPESYHSDRLRVLIGAYYAVPDGAPWKQDGSWWGPTFTMSQLPVTTNPPLRQGPDNFELDYIHQEYKPASDTRPASLDVTYMITVRNQRGQRCCVNVMAYYCDGNRQVSNNGETASHFEPFTAQGDINTRKMVLSVPWSKLPASAMSERIHLSLSAFRMEAGKWVQKGSAVWAPEFVPSKLMGGVTPPRPVSGSKPVLDWINLPSATSDRQLKIKVGVTSSSTITAKNVFVNGKIVRGVTPVTNDGYDLMINEAASLVEGENTIQVTVANAAGTTSETRTVTYQPRRAPSGSTPTLTWISCPATATSNQITVKLGVKSTTTITSSAIYVNGQQMRGVTPVANDGYDMVITKPVTLVNGVNIIKAVVTNAAGTVSEERQVTVGSQPIVNPNKKTVPAQDITDSNLKRIALVVGNSQYPGQELVNTINDANAMNLKLRNLGFDVIFVSEASRRTLDQKINEFGQQARNYDVALFYYAGHGIQYQGANYLIPVDAEMASESDIEYECTNVNRVLSKLEESGCKMKIIALDACRNNPFERSWHRGTGRGRGLSAINAPVGTFISYATSPGTTASDGETEHSPYTEALLSVLDIPDLPIETVFKRVATKVFQLTNKTQTPWYSSSLFEGEFIFNPSR